MEDGSAMAEATQRIEGKERILGQNPEVAWSEGRGRVGNLQESIRLHRQEAPEFWESLKDKTVFIKPNLVDPEHPDSITNPQTLGFVVEEMARSGVKKIRIGDVPMIEVVKRMDSEGTDILKIYQQVGYTGIIDGIRKNHPGLEIEFVDPRKLEQEELGETGLKVAKLESDVLVNLALPKEHGQYYFTCASKNLMGLTQASERESHFHQHGGNKEELQARFNELAKPENAKSLQEKLIKAKERLVQEGILKEGQKEIDQEQLQQLNLQLQLEVLMDLAQEHDGENMQKMAGFVTELSDHLSEEGITVLTIVDGAQLMTGHEHLGKMHDLNIAAVGLNPAAVDKLVAARVGVESEYTGLLVEQNSIQPELKGKSGLNVPTRKRERTYRGVDRKFGRFWYSIDSDMPKEGFEDKNIRNKQATTSPESGKSVKGVSTLDQEDSIQANIDNVQSKKSPDMTNEIHEAGEAEPKLKIECAAESDVGRKRTLDEDSFFSGSKAEVGFTFQYGLAKTSEELEEPVKADATKIFSHGVDGLFVVADGMGGHQAGDEASQLAISGVLAKLAETEDWINLPEAEIKAKIAEAVGNANQAVFDRKKSSGTDLGTTLTMAMVINGKLYTANVGDSRVYLYDETSKDLTQLTTDHSLVQRLVDAGQITQAEARTHSKKNVIYKTLGDKDHVGVDVSDAIEVKANMRLLVCCDGLPGMVEDKDLKKIVSQDKPSNDIVGELIKAANEAGGDDNITAIVAKLEVSKPPTTEPIELDETQKQGETSEPPPPTPVSKPAQPEVVLSPREILKKKLEDNSVLKARQELYDAFVANGNRTVEGSGETRPTMHELQTREMVAVMFKDLEKDDQDKNMMNILRHLHGGSDLVDTMDVYLDSKTAGTPERRRDLENRSSQEMHSLRTVNYILNPPKGVTVEGVPDELKEKLNEFVIIQRHTVHLGLELYTADLGKRRNELTRELNSLRERRDKLYKELLTQDALFSEIKIKYAESKTIPEATQELPGTADKPLSLRKGHASENMTGMFEDVSKELESGESVYVELNDLWISELTKESLKPPIETPNGPNSIKVKIFRADVLPRLKQDEKPGEIDLIVNTTVQRKRKILGMEVNGLEWGMSGEMTLKNKEDGSGVVIVQKAATENGGIQRITTNPPKMLGQDMGTLLYSELGEDGLNKRYVDYLTEKLGDKAKGVRLMITDEGKLRIDFLTSTPKVETPAPEPQPVPGTVEIPEEIKPAAERPLSEKSPQELTQLRVSAEEGLIVAQRAYKEDKSDTNAKELTESVNRYLEILKEQDARLGASVDALSPEAKTGDTYKQFTDFDKALREAEKRLKEAQNPKDVLKRLGEYHGLLRMRRERAKKLLGVTKTADVVHEEIKEKGPDKSEEVLQEELVAEEVVAPDDGDKKEKTGEREELPVSEEVSEAPAPEVVEEFVIPDMSEEQAELLKPINNFLLEEKGGVISNIGAEKVSELKDMVKKAQAGGVLVALSQDKDGNIAVMCVNERSLLSGVYIKDKKKEGYTYDYGYAEDISKLIVIYENKVSDSKAHGNKVIISEDQLVLQALKDLREKIKAKQSSPEGKEAEVQKETEPGETQSEEVVAKEVVPNDQESKEKAGELINKIEALVQKELDSEEAGLVNVRYYGPAYQALKEAYPNETELEEAVTKIIREAEEGIAYLKYESERDRERIFRFTITSILQGEEYSELKNAATKAADAEFIRNSGYIKEGADLRYSRPYYDNVLFNDLFVALSSKAKGESEEAEDEQGTVAEEPVTGQVAAPPEEVGGDRETARKDLPQQEELRSETIIEPEADRQESDKQAMAEHTPPVNEEKILETESVRQDIKPAEEFEKPEKALDFRRGMVDYNLIKIKPQDGGTEVSVLIWWDKKGKVHQEFVDDKGDVLEATEPSSQGSLKNNPDYVKVLIDRLAETQEVSRGHYFAKDESGELYLVSPQEITKAEEKETLPEETGEKVELSPSELKSKGFPDGVEWYQITHSTKPAEGDKPAEDFYYAYWLKGGKLYRQECDDDGVLKEEAESYTPDNVGDLEGARKMVGEQMKRSREKERRSVEIIKLYKEQPASDENAVTN